VVAHLVDLLDLAVDPRHGPFEHGGPRRCGCHATPSKRVASVPLFANFQHRSLCLSLSTLTQKLPASFISAQVSESVWGRKPTSGGSSDTDVNEPIVKPCGRSPSAMPVITVTPVGKCPSTVRKCLESKASGRGVCSLITSNCTLPPMTDRTTAIDSKVELRARMRRLRRSLAGRDERSARLWGHVEAIGAVVAARRVLAFSTIPGEPDVGPFVEWCRARDVQIAVPEGAVEATWPDVVLVPGLAFTTTGGRLGQGGGWYDRFLADVRPECTTIGVCFAEQVVDELPIEPHDVAVDIVVTDDGPCR
jgi:5-formyltetrahydrofolate cyclo-ligase